MAFANILSPLVLKKYLEFWISEDIPNFDLSAIALSSKEVCAHIKMNEEGVLAGLPFAEALFKYLDCKVEWRCPEGSIVKDKTVVCEVRGLSSKVMMAERTALNILSRASGVATIARRVQSKMDKGWKGEISGTRKTSPGMRMVEKYAMYIGGISTHRYDLSSMIMLKDNHIKINGSIEKSVRMIKEKVGSLIMIEVECRSVKEALEAAKSGANVVMLDNFEAKDVKTASKQVKEAHPSVLIEVSGQINENNILTYAVPNVDIISSSIFCQGYKCIDLSLNIVNQTISLTPEIVATVKEASNALDIEVIDLDINDKSSEFDLPESSVTSTPKTGIKRKLDEAPTKPVDSKIVTTTVDNSKKEIKEVDKKIVTATVRPAVVKPATIIAAPNTAPTKVTVTSVTKPPTKTDVTPNKQVKPNNDVAKPNTAVRVGGFTSTLSKNLATARTAGYRVNNNSSTPRVAPSTMSSSLLSLSSNSNHGNMMRPMANVMGLSFPGNQPQSSSQHHHHQQQQQQQQSLQSQQHNDAFFHGATPMKLAHRSSMNNLVDQRTMAASTTPYRTYGATNKNADSGYGFFCKTCNYQNPINGPPICRVCRKMLV